MLTYKDICKSDYFKEKYAKIEELKKDFPVNHGFVHVSHVLKNAKRLAKLFNLDKKDAQLLLIAASLHDIGYLDNRDNHPQSGAVLAKEYLKDKLPEEDLSKVCLMIASHGGKHKDDYQNLCCICMILADKLDFIASRYDKEKIYDRHKIYLTIKATEIVKCKNYYQLVIKTTNKSLFSNISEHHFFQKLQDVLNKIYEYGGIRIEIDIKQI